METIKRDSKGKFTKKEASRKDIRRGLLHEIADMHRLNIGSVLIQVVFLDEDTLFMQFVKPESIEEATYRKAAIATVKKFEKILNGPAHELLIDLMNYELYLIREYNIKGEDLK